MGENSAIEWTDHSFNPWTGCTKVSAACDHCYAESWSKRSGHVEWGPHGVRRRTKTWGNPIKWNQQALEAGVRYRVFCASLADIGDNHKSIDPQWRRDLVAMMRECTQLDWLLLTKRPQNIAKLYPDLMEDWPAHVWLGASTENREEMLRRGEALAALPSAITFWSAEPLVEGLGQIPPDIMPSWVIAGGESGHGARPSHPAWFRSLRDQCAAADVPFFFKQWGDLIPWEWHSPPDMRSQHGQWMDANTIPHDEAGELAKGWTDGCLYDGDDGCIHQRVGKKAAGRLLDGVRHSAYPATERRAR